MRFDEVNLDENVLQGIEAMNFQEMTPVQDHSGHIRRERYHRMRSDRNR